MFEAYSAGYYLGHFFVEPHRADYALMELDRHQDANTQVYAADEGINRLDNPLVVKLDNQHLPVLGAPGIPHDTLAVPEVVLETSQIDDPPTLKDILIAKAEWASQLLAWCTPYSVQPPDVA